MVTSIGNGPVEITNRMPLSITHNTRNSVYTNRTHSKAPPQFHINLPKAIMLIALHSRNSISSLAFLFHLTPSPMTGRVIVAALFQKHTHGGFLPVTGPHLKSRSTCDVYRRCVTVSPQGFTDGGSLFIRPCIINLFGYTPNRCSHRDMHRKIYMGTCCVR